ncbi:MAG: hypothetical protein WBB19_08660 [Desulforhopalus sp.]
MKDKMDNKPQLRQIGKGFIVNPMEGMVGRILTQTFMDQNQQTYVKVNGEIIPLTEQHDYLSVN